ncbi:MAG: DNA cytosine methyltransferase [Lentimicrobium sp.]|jgi:DNA (cytosine-5)-methyltransferase 1|nr:DNA cytosine methyltransferase [Lentimicrobium sp.]
MKNLNSKDKGRIPIIDLFAGPGGLGEGFSSITDENGSRFFKIKLSIEKDEQAHMTLRLRSFYRQFEKEDVPEIYYSYIKENNLKKQAELLEQLKTEYKDEWSIAEDEAWRYELPYPVELDKKGNKKGGYTDDEIKEKNKEIDERICNALHDEKEFLLIGGPPCQAFSLVGRARNQGISDDDHRVHLYREYLRIIARHHPAVFVMENVKGLLSAKIGEHKVFDEIKKDLKNPGIVFPDYNSPLYKVFSLVKPPDEFDSDGFPIYYNDTDYLIKSEKYGIPQRRHRVILIGIREDLEVQKPEYLYQSEEIKLKSVIGKLPALRSGIGREIISENEKGNHTYSKIQNNQTNWEDAIILSREKLNYLFRERDKTNDIKFPTSQGKNFLSCNLDESSNPLYSNWYCDSRLKGVINHETRTHLKEDLMRYLFSALYLNKYGDFPKLRDYPEWLLPMHKNAKGGKFADRFRTQRPDEPATTVTSHISKDGHYFIHYDPIQCRSLTVREAARIQTFPDNYYFCGARTAQYHQVGNAVPPYLAKQIGEIVFEIFKR